SASTGSRSTWAIGGSISGRATPSPSSGSTSKQATGIRVHITRTKCSRWCAASGRQPPTFRRHTRSQDGARPQTARDPRLPRGQGPAAVLRRRVVALQPASQAAVRGPRRHPDHAHRRGRDGRRRRRRAPACKSRSRRRAPDVRGLKQPVAVDSLNVSDALCGLPEQLAAAHEQAGEIDRHRLPSAHDLDHHVTLGGGGPGGTGDIVQAAGTVTLPLPLVVLKHYRTPSFVGPRTLAFAVSYSGETEETLEMARGAFAAGAHVITVSSGGALADF